MFRIKLLITISLFAFCAVHSVTAQEVNKPAQIASVPVITGTASAERLRFTAPSTVVEMHLQIYSDSGQAIFDVSSKGNVLDWALQDSAGEHLSNGSYLCVVTVKNLSGRLSQRICSVSVAEKQIELQRVDSTRLTPAQQQAVGPVEENAALTILKAGEPQATTVVANDGQDGQIVRDHGALSFRIGDFFSGRDTEQMRLTEEGNLGIGTDKPQAKLDVAGVIRTSKGIEFENGIKLTTTAAGSLQQTLTDGTVVTNATSTGTQNKIAKWLDNAGTLGDSNLFEDATGNIGVGTTTPNPSGVLHVNKSQNGATALFVTNNNAGSSVISSVRAALDPTNVAVNYASLNILGPNWPTGAGGALLKGRTGLLEVNGSNFGIGNYSDTEPINFYTTSGRLERMRINANGNVGIGTNNPSAKLEVAGNVRLSGANSGLIFPDGTSLTTAASGGTMSGTSIVNAVNDPATVGTISDARLSPNVARLNGTNNFIGNENVTGNISVSGDPSGLTGNIGAAGQMSATTAFFGTISGNNLAVDSDTLIVNPSTHRVGIGTNAPGEKLSVAGTVQSTSGGFKFPDGSVQTTAAAETFTVNSSTDVEINPNGTTTGTPILHLDLAPGNYLVFGMVELENRADLFAQDNRRNVLCDISPSSQGTAVIGGSGDTNMIVMNLHGLITLTQVYGVTLSCRARSGGTDRSYVHTGFRRLTAMRIGNITHE